MELLETYVDQRINTTILDHLPRILGRGEICLSIQSNMAEGVLVQELDSPLQETQKASNNAEDDITDHVALRRLLLPGDGTDLAQELNDSNE